MKKKLFLLLAVLLAVGQNAFAYDFSYTYQGKTLFYTIQENGVSVENPLSGNYYSYVTGDLVIPDSVENNGTKYAVTSISDYAFYNCSGLTSVTIPNSVTSIGYWAFYNCGLTSLTIPNSVTSIGNCAFRGCIGLTSLTIPNSVTSIGDWAFDGCSSLTSVTIPNSVTSISDGAFYNCSGLTSVTIPNSVVSIDQQAFYHCSSLTSVTIPNSVTDIGEQAFDHCGSLTSVTIPNSVTDIGGGAFNFCEGLTSVYCEATTPPTLGPAVFSNTHYCPIYVLCGSVSAYQSALRWSDYASRIQGMADLDYSYSFVSNNETMGTVSAGDVDCDSNLTVTATANSGYQFTGWSDGGTGNPRTFHLTSDTSVTALFDYISYAVVGLSSDAARGSVSGSDTVHYNETVTLVATANYGYHFQHWQDSNTDNPRTVVVSGDIIYTAYFDPNSYTVTLHSADSSQGTVSGSGVADYLEEMHITATPATGYHFSYWSDGDSNASRDITVLGDTTLIAYFEANRYTVIVITDNNTMGTVSDGGTYDYGDTILIEAFPAEHYHFMHWNDGNRDNPRLYRVENDITLTAFFAIDTHTVHVVSNDIVRGMVESTGTQFAYGTPCTVTATAYTGYVFTGWSNGITANPYTFAVTGDVELTALFEEEGTQAITDIDAADITVYAIEGRIVVRGAEGMEVSIFDVMGREVIRSTRLNETPILPNGIYLIKIASLPAQKIVVVR